MTYQFISDPAHGWLRVPLAEIAGLEFTPYSYQDDEYAYLEEDSDAGTFINARGLTADDITERYINGPAFVRNLPELENRPAYNMVPGAGAPQYTFDTPPDTQLTLF